MKMANNLTDSTNPVRELFARLYTQIDFSTDEMLEEEEYSSNKDLVSYANGIKGSPFTGIGGSSCSSCCRFRS